MTGAKKSQNFLAFGPKRAYPRGGGCRPPGLAGREGGGRAGNNSRLGGVVWGCLGPRPAEPMTVHSGFRSRDPNDKTGKVCCKPDTPHMMYLSEASSRMVCPNVS